MDASIWTLIRTSGPGAWAAVFFAFLGAAIGLVGIVVAIAGGRRVAYGLGAAGIVLAFFSVASSLLGVAYGKRRTEAALEGFTLGKIRTESIRRVGYQEAQGAAAVGYVVAVFPLLVGALAVLLAARRKEGESAPGRMAIGVGIAVAATVATGVVARAESQRALPGHALPDGNPGWDLLAAYEASTNDIDRACLDLEETLENSYWLPTRRSWYDSKSGRIMNTTSGSRRDFPRAFEPDPRAALPEFEAFANRCVRRWLGSRDGASPYFRHHSPADFIESPLLLNPSIFNEEEARAFNEVLASRRRDEGGDFEPDADNAGAIGMESAPDARARTAPASAGPSVRQGTLQVNGKLSLEVVQRIVSQNMGRFRLCYENELRDHPKLAGRVSVTFVIDEQGNVADTKLGSDLSNAALEACVQRGMASLSFPVPEKGKVKVVYPLIFSPRGD